MKNASLLRVWYFLRVSSRPSVLRSMTKAPTNTQNYIGNVSSSDSSVFYHNRDFRFGKFLGNRGSECCFCGSPSPAPPELPEIFRSFQYACSHSLSLFVALFDCTTPYHIIIIIHNKFSSSSFDILVIQYRRQQQQLYYSDEKFENRITEANEPNLPKQISEKEERISRMSGRQQQQQPK